LSQKQGSTHKNSLNNAPTSFFESFLPFNTNPQDPEFLTLFLVFLPQTRGTRENLESETALARQTALCYCDTAPRHCTPPLGQHSPLSSTAAAFTPTAGLQHRSCIAQTQKTQLIIGDH